MDSIAPSPNIPRLNSFLVLISWSKLDPPRYKCPAEVQLILTREQNLNLIEAENKTWNINPLYVSHNPSPWN